MTNILKTTCNTILASLLVVLLVACGSNQTDSVDNLLSTGVATATKSADFGKPASAETVAATAKELASYFDGKHANNPEALMGVQPTSSGSSSSSSSNSTSQTATPMIAASNVSKAVFRFFNTRTSTHFYTMSVAERDYVQATFPFFNFEGTSFFAYPDTDPTLSPVYRFFNKVTGTHFFTINASEKDHVIATWPDIFNFEGISWYASPTARAGWIPAYRFFNTKTGTHFYTTSAGERDHVLATWSWFTFEGIAYYVRPDATPPDITPPVITVLGANPLNLSAGTAYTEAGASCVDDKDTTCTVITTGTVNTAVAGTYTMTYTATDATGNTSSKTRTVTVATCTAAAIGSTGYSLVFKGCSATNVAEYYDKTECVRDNRYGLIWQGQTPAGTGLRANGEPKTNLDRTTGLQRYFGEFAGVSTYRFPTQGEIDHISNSIGFKNAVNATNLCGSGAWRIPDREELESRTRGNDSEWFPNATQVDIFWSSTNILSAPHEGWVVNFYSRNAHNQRRDYEIISGYYANLVRLVRCGDASGCILP
jgi:Domain of unknown function (DUF5011)/Protein of unknown function (DUF1566)/Repeat of unknown function (DUF5648)